MNTRAIRTLIVAIGLTIASAPIFAAKEECEHSWSNEHKNEGGARFDKHMAALHDALKLTSDQDAAWAQFIDKMKPVEMDKPRHQDWKDMSTPDRLDRMLDNMKSHEKQMAGHAEAIRAFYGALTPDQQKVFDKKYQAHHQRHDRHSHDKK